MSVFSDMIDGLVTRLGTVTGLHPYNHPPDVINEYPAAVVLLQRVNLIPALGGDSVEVEMKVVYLQAANPSDEAFSGLYDAIDPAPAGTTSVVKQIRADRTLDGKADDSEVVAVENIGRRAIESGGFLAGADFIVKAIKRI